MLPRTNGLRTTDFNRFAHFQRPDTIWNNTIQRPITATYHITGSNTGYTLTMLFIFFWIEKTPAPRSNRYLGCTLTAGVRIVATHRFVFAITPNLFLILVTLISGYHHAYFNTIRNTNCFENVNSTHNVGSVSFYGYVVTKTYQWLGCQMKHNIRAVFAKNSFHPFTVANVGTNVSFNPFSDAGKDKVVTFTERFLSYTYNLCTKLM